MLTKCLKALTSPLAAEHTLPDDILLAAPGELLSIPVHACREEHNPACQCRRVFVGIETGNPTTLARVCLADADTVHYQVEADSKVIPYTMAPDVSDGMVLHGVDCVANALRHFRPGALLRINRTATAVYLEDT